MRLVSQGALLGCTPTLSETQWWSKQWRPRSAGVRSSGFTTASATCRGADRSRYTWTPPGPGRRRRRRPQPDGRGHHQPQHWQYTSQLTKSTRLMGRRKYGLVRIATWQQLQPMLVRQKSSSCVSRPCRSRWHNGLASLGSHLNALGFAAAYAQHTCHFVLYISHYDTCRRST